MTSVNILRYYSAAGENYMNLLLVVLATGWVVEAGFLAVTAYQSKMSFIAWLCLGLLAPLILVVFLTSLALDGAKKYSLPERNLCLAR